MSMFNRTKRSREKRVDLKGWCIFCCLFPVFALADELGGQLEAKLDGESVSFPVLKTDISADIHGDLATITVIQTFANPMDEPVHASYLFPLNKEAAVNEMVMEVGSERIKAQIQEIQQAKKTFAKAKSEGKSAALLTQHRPNMFTQDIANLMPKLPIKVTMKYVQTVPRVDNHYELVVPLVVGPRYQPKGAGIPPVSAGSNEDQAAASDSATSFGKWELEALPSYPSVAGVDLPKSIESERVSLSVSIHGGMPINGAYSDTHSITMKKVTLEDWHITLSKGRVIDNRDFVLRYGLSGTKSQAGLLAHKDERGGFFSLLLEPPALPASEDITPREMVFVLDCSGSMSGLPMNASKAFMREALNHLRPSDWFRVIRFSDAATEFSSKPLRASGVNINKGLSFTEQLYGSGGTEMMSGIRQALEPSVPHGAMRIVVFLTDGYIGNEASILSYINDNIDDTRIYAFGVGTSVNRYLLSEVARTGRGFARYMDPTESVDEVAKSLAGRLQTPVLTDISIDWGKLSPTEVNPDPIPDLFAGQSVRVMGRYTQAGSHVIRVHGKVNGRPATLPLQVTLPQLSNDGEGIALVWARSKVKQLMGELLMPESRRLSGMHDDHIKQTVTDLGLDFSLVTKWTAFVAVSERIYNSAPELTKETQVPLPMVKGVTKKAYDNSPGSNQSQAFHGYSAPEPSVYFGMVLLSLLFGIWLYKTRRMPA